jgi:hypothetical protein
MPLIWQFMQKSLALMRSEQGSLSVLFAVAGIALMGMMAVTVDVGLAYATRAKLQVAADAAALAGVPSLPGNPVGAVNTARSYAMLNGVNPEQISVEVSPDHRRLIVTVTNEVNFFFGSFVGMAEGEIVARAEALIGSVGQLSGGAVPVGVLEQPQGFDFGREYLLKAGAGGDGGKGKDNGKDDGRGGGRQPPEPSSLFGQGNYGALDLDGRQGGGANDYRNRLRDGYEGTLEIGDIIPTERGNMAGPTRDGINARIARCTVPGCSFDRFNSPDAPLCPHVVFVPVYQETSDKNFVRIVGFAAFYISRVVEKGGQEAEIRGYFIRTITPQGTIGEGQEEFGLMAVMLAN